MFSFFRNPYINHEKPALVLAGGGAKGTYQIGAWKALRELGISFSGVVGTSVGALNGAFITQNDFNKAFDLWSDISLDKIVSLPMEVMENGKFVFSRQNLRKVLSFNKKIIQNGGLDTSPMFDIIEKNIDVAKIIKSPIDFGMLTFSITTFEPTVYFAKDRQGVNLHKYLMASASLPGFKQTQIGGNIFTDGGVYNNIPFAEARQRGYRNIIIIDVIGLGMNRRPDVAETRTIYIRPSIDMGNVIYFEKQFLRDFMELGYLDTLRTFGNLNGVDYFFKDDSRLCKKLEHIYQKEEVFKECESYFDHFYIKNGTSKMELLYTILPEKMKNHKNPIACLAECAALTLQIERKEKYTFRKLLTLIWTRFCNYSYNENTSTEVDIHKNFFQKLGDKLQKLNFKKHFFKYSPYEYKKSFEAIFGNNKKSLKYKTLLSIFPEITGAEIFLVILKHYYRGR